MEKLEKELPFARQPRSDVSASPAPSERDALLQLLLPLLPGNDAAAGMPEAAPGDGTDASQLAGQADMEGPPNRENSPFIGPRWVTGSSSAEVLPGREEEVAGRSQASGRGDNAGQLARLGGDGSAAFFRPSDDNAGPISGSLSGPLFGSGTGMPGQRGGLGEGRSDADGALAGQPAAQGAGGLLGTRPGFPSAGVPPQAARAPNDPPGAGPGPLSGGSVPGALGGLSVKPGDGPTGRGPVDGSVPGALGGLSVKPGDGPTGRGPVGGSVPGPVGGSVPGALGGLFVKPGDGPTSRGPVDGSVPGALGGLPVRPGDGAGVPLPVALSDDPTAPGAGPLPADGSSMAGDADAPAGPRGPQNANGDRPRGADTPASQPTRSASLDPAAVRPGVAAGSKVLLPEVDPAQSRGPAGLAAGRGVLAAALVSGEAAAAESSLGAAAAQSSWGKQETPGGFGQQVAVGLAGLASDSVDARRQAFGGTARARSDLENLEPVALGMQQRRTMQSFTAPAAMQPVVAQIAADMYRLQTARLDQLMASRAADEDGEPPPLDADEAMQRQRAVKEVDLGGMWRWDLAPSIPPSSLDEAAPVHLPFRAALLTVTMQDPAAVLPMFAREGDRDGLRLYVPNPEAAGSLRARWEAVQLGSQGPLGWMAAAEQVFMRAYPQGDAREALQALLGREAKTETVVGDEASAKRLWKQLCCANSPRQVPTVLRTLALEGIPLAADHAYGVLGTFVRDGAWMVTLCDPLAAPDDNVLSVPFAAIRRSADTLTVSARASL